MRFNSSYLFILPALVTILAITYLGVGYNAWVSTLDWNGIAPDPKYVGLGNYAAILADPIFASAILHVALFAAITISAELAIGFTMAVVLSGPVFGRSIYKILVFVPVVLAPAAVAGAFRQILSPTGALNEFLRAIGLDGLTHAWVADPHLALFALAAVDIWEYTGFAFILYLAALTQIDSELIEAAQIDGAGSLRILRSVVFPQLRGTHITLVILGVIGSLRTFDIVWLITGGGPGRSTEFVTTYIFKQAVLQFHAGYGAALSIVFLVIALTLTLIQMRVYRFGRS